MSPARDDSWEEFAEKIRELESLLSQSHARTVRGNRARRAARYLAQKFLREARPHLVELGVAEVTVARFDSPVRVLLDLSHQHGERTVYVRRLAEIRRLHSEVGPLREAHIGSRGSETGQRVVILTPIEQSIVRTLQALNPVAAGSYQQAVIDLAGPSRHSYRGVAHELREALRETLDHFAPDADVMAEAGFQLEKGVARPTHRQKALYVLRKRRVSAEARKAPEQAVAMVDELGASIARSTYSRGSISAHGQASATEVRQMKMYVDAVLAELLEVHKEG